MDAPRLSIWEVPRLIFSMSEKNMVLRKDDLLFWLHLYGQYIVNVGICVIENSSESIIHLTIVEAVIIHDGCIHSVVII